MFLYYWYWYLGFTMGILSKDLLKKETFYWFLAWMAWVLTGFIIFYDIYTTTTTDNTKYWETDSEVRENMMPIALI